MILIQYFILLFFPLITTPATGKPSEPDRDLAVLRIQCGLEKTLPEDVFTMAMNGYYRMDTLLKKKLLTIIDYSKPSVQKRFFVIDPVKKVVLFQSLVAHGKYSGDNYATRFSNVYGSLKSCLGFFITGETYYGRHGYSLRLDGLEPGFNDNARKRAIVIHGADYVSRQVAADYGQLGKSWGCPALPQAVTKEIIDTISNGSCLFIYGKDEGYLKTSGFLN